MCKSSDDYMYRITTDQLGLDALRRFEREALPMPRRLGNGKALLFIAKKVLPGLMDRSLGLLFAASPGDGQMF